MLAIQILAHKSLFLRYVWFLQHKTITYLNSINQLLFIIQMHFVYSKVGH